MRYPVAMTDSRNSDRERRRAAALRANLARRKALARSLGSEDTAQAQASQTSASRAAGEGSVDGGGDLG